MTLNAAQLVSEENFSRLVAYRDQLRAAGLSFPSRGGKVNKTAVATACGFNRETFTQNKRFDDFLTEAVSELGLEVLKTVEPVAKDNGDKARVTMLEQQMAALRSENLDLRRKLASYEHATTTGRRVIP